MKGIYFEDGQNFHIKDDDEVSVITYDSSSKIKIKNCSKHNDNLSRYRKINANEYVDTETAEILEYKKYEYKSKSSICRSMKNLREIVSNNFNGGKNELFITLTYEDRQADFDKTVSDLGDFWDRFKKEFQDLEYIAIIENQESRDSWHIHMWVKDTVHRKLYISKDEIERIWNNGFADVAKITDKGIKDIIGGYKFQEDDNEEVKKDAMNKLADYMCKTKSKDNIPSNKKCYYKSRGIKKPTIQKMSYKEAQKVLDKNNCYLVWEKTLLIRSVNTDSILNKIKEEIYDID